MPAHVALFVADLEGGGAQRSMVDLACAFHARGLGVDLLALKPLGELRGSLPTGVRVVALERQVAKLPLVAGKKRRRALASVPVLIKYLRRERPRALLATSESINVCACVAARLAGGETRVVLRIDNPLTRAPELAGTFSQRRRERRARRAYRWADRWIAISEGVADDAARVTGIPREHIVAIHNPVLTPSLRERSTARIEHPWLAAGGDPVVIGVGRLVPQKDFATLIRAFARVRSRRRARLLILGEGPLNSTLGNLAAKQGVAADVCFTGYVANAPAWMARATLLALSSAYEGFGRVLVEALAVGCPVVSTNCPSGPSEILGGGAFGPLVPVRDDAALAAAIESVLDRPPSRKVLMQRAEAFSIEPAAERYIQVLLESGFAS